MTHDCDDWNDGACSRCPQPVLCCWCDAPATRNLDSYYDVACDVHHAQWFADAEAAS